MKATARKQTERAAGESGEAARRLGREQDIILSRLTRGLLAASPLVRAH